MWEIRAGATRTVLLTKCYAIKIPRVYRANHKWEWIQFLHGLEANLQERYWAKWRARDVLCPILYADPIGLLVIMPRCRLLERAICPVEVVWFREYANVPIDAVTENFGWLGERLVLLDYGT